MAASAAPGSSRAASDRASPSTSFHRRSWRTSSRACSTSRIAGASRGDWSFRPPRRVERSGASVPLATCTTAALTCHSAFLARACRSMRRPEHAERRVPLEEVGPSSGDGRRRAVGLALERRRAAEADRVVSGRSPRGQHQAARHPEHPPAPTSTGHRDEPVAELVRPIRPRISPLVRGHRPTEPGRVARARSHAADIAARSRASSCSASHESGPSRPIGCSSVGGRLPSAPGPNELTPKIAPSGAWAARACRVIP